MQTQRKAEFGQRNAEFFQKRDKEERGTSSVRVRGLVIASRVLPITIFILCFSVLGLSAQSFGQNKVNAIDANWSMIRSMHFDVYFPAGNDDFGRLVTLMAEETYYKLKEDLRFPLSSRVPLIVYGSKTEFQGTNIIYPLLTEGIGGFTESLRNRVVIPFEGSYVKLEELLAHELVHAYTNAMDRGSSLVSSLRPASFPFWFSEGLPEFLSIGGEDDFNNMFILDMVVNEKLPPLEYSDGYLAYRLGESFISYIAEVWGREKVSEYYFALRGSRGTDEATKKVFGMELEELESRWRYHLKRMYFPAVNLHGTPKEDLEQRTFSQKDGSYFNYMPRFSPDGQRYVYFSNQGARYSVWMSGTHGLSRPQKLITGEATGQMEEFYYFRANLSWFPDNRRVAFGAKNSTGDVIHILDTQREKIVSSIRIPELRAIYEIDVSPDGEKILISGQMGTQSDIFVYEIASRKLERLTDDLFWDAQARWAPDGKSIVFASERVLNEAGTRRGFFANYRSAIFKMELESGEMWRMSWDEGNCSFPMFDGSGKKLLYVSSREGISNLRIIDMEGGRKGDVTDVLSGVYAGDISADGRYLLVSNYFNGGWDIYFGYNPLDSLTYSEAPVPQPWESQGDIWDKVDLSQLDLFGRRPKQRPKRINPSSQYDARRPNFGTAPEFEYTRQDSLLFFQDFSYDDRPSEPGAKLPKVEDYRGSFAIEHLWGGLAYSSSAGAIGYLELGLADIMGNHGIGINAGFSGILEENDLLLSYLYLKKRSDFGVGVYNIFDDVIFREQVPGPDNYFRFVQRQTGVYLLWRYPFNRFMRFEFDQMLHQRKTRWDEWGWNSDASNGQWNQATEPEYDMVWAPGVSLVHDNALFGSTGPLVGWRAMGTVRTSISDAKLDYVTAYADWRGYRLFNRRYGLAARAMAGVSSGDNAQYFDLWGLDGVRGHDDYDTGHKKLLTSAELRFPFFDYIAMAFPVPLTIPNIRGAIFADAGTVFDELKDFRPMQSSKLKDLKLGYGFGPRLNLGYVVLRLDIAWASDLSRISKPAYFLSLSEDF